jgi:hypothetical protein
MAEFGEVQFVADCAGNIVIVEKAVVHSPAYRIPGYLSLV